MEREANQREARKRGDGGESAMQRDPKRESTMRREGKQMVVVRRVSQTVAVSQRKQTKQGRKGGVRLRKKHSERERELEPVWIDFFKKKALIFFLKKVIL